MAATLEGFEAIQWDSPLDPAAYLDEVPDDVTVKGMFVSRLLADAAHGGVEVMGRGPYRAFKDYPLREMMELQVFIASTMFARLPLREALRRLGWTAFATLMDSMIGKVIFAPVGRDVGAALRLASRGYKVSLSVSEVSVHEVDEEHALLLRLGRLYNFADSYQVGVIEGAIRHYGHEPDIAVRVRSRCDIDVLARWL